MNCSSRLHRKMIAIIGTDGAGKSTVISMLVPRIESFAGKNVIVHHLKPDLLPPLGHLRGVKYTVGGVCKTPHGARPSGAIVSLLRITYLSLDYILGYWLKVRTSLKRGDIACWIFDRYAYDILIDPVRFRIRLPRWAILFFLKIIPCPDIILCLGGNPEKIFARKPETSLAEVQRQVAELKRFCAGNKRAVWIDTTTSIEDSCNTAMESIWKLNYDFFHTEQKSCKD